MNLNLVRRFFKFTVPSIVSMWIFSLYSLVDGMFVAWGVGEHALTAVNLSLPFVSLVFTLGILLATGTSTVLSIALGQKDVERARNYFNQNLFVVIAATLLLAVLVLFNLDWVADFLGATGENHHLVKEYVGVIACFSVFFTVSYNLEVQVKADGAPHVSIIGVISCGLMNVVLDYIFVPCGSAGSSPTPAPTAALSPWVPPTASASSPTAWSSSCSTTSYSVSSAPAPWCPIPSSAM